MVLENFLRAARETTSTSAVVTNAAHYLKGKRDNERAEIGCRLGPTTPQGCSRPYGQARELRHILPCRGRPSQETEAPIKQLGLKGIFIHSSHKGQLSDDDQARPFWEAECRISDVR